MKPIVVYDIVATLYLIRTEAACLTENYAAGRPGKHEEGIRSSRLQQVYVLEGRVTAWWALSHPLCPAR